TASRSRGADERMGGVLGFAKGARRVNNLPHALSKTCRRGRTTTEMRTYPLQQRDSLFWIEIDHGRLADNVRQLKRAAAEAELWAVVKADGYGHGAVETARIALAHGVKGLAVAAVEEGV